jgi:hypothetical protein
VSTEPTRRDAMRPVVLAVDDEPARRRYGPGTLATACCVPREARTTLPTAS